MGNSHAMLYSTTAVNDKELNTLHATVSSDGTINVSPLCHSLHVDSVASANVVQGRASYDDHKSLLWKVAESHCDGNGTIVTVLATADFAEMLQNFLVSVVSTNFNPKNILVLTESHSIVVIANAFGAGVFYLDGVPPSELAFKFGTLSYQQLMLKRTQLVLKLLELNFIPLVADIDAVWLHNPLEEIYNELAMDAQARGQHQEPLTIDIVATDDHGEICGCFVYVRPTTEGIRFWREVLRRHTQVVESSNWHDESRVRYSETEQHILTTMILQRDYDGIDSLQVRILAPHMFPSGFLFFNQGNGIGDLVESSAHAFDVLRNAAEEFSVPAIIHNNFVVGKSMKKYRFLRHGLGLIPPPVHHLFKALAPPIAKVVFDSLEIWDGIARVERFVFPSLNMMQPIHDEAVGDHTVTQVSTEGFESGKDVGNVYVEYDPITSMNFSVFGVYDVVFSRNNSVNRISVQLQQSNGQLYVDVLHGNNGVFAMDREILTAPADKMHSHMLANQFVLQKNSVLKEMVPPTEELLRFLESFNEVTGFKLNFKIKVLAFNQPEKLERLLASIAAAKMLNVHVDMEIFVDHNRTIDEGIVVGKTVEVANAFSWSHGQKTVVLRDRHQGTMNQWFNCWNPTKDNELAFVFEDDVQVSPYFFVWALKAAKQYYASADAQRQLHLELFQRVMESDPMASLREWVVMTAGKPILFGICPRFPEFDALHHHMRMNVRTARRPFLHSVISPVGSLLLPLVWQAFRQWWWLIIQDQHDLIKNITAIGFYRHDINVLMTRFALETGVKCLYPNLPDGAALIARSQTKELLPALTVEYFRRAIHQNAAFGLQLLNAAAYLPSIDVLANWQFDLNQRRAGSLVGQQKLVALTYDCCENSTSAPFSASALSAFCRCACRYPNVQAAVKFRESSVSWFRGIAQVHYICRNVDAHHSCQVTDLTGANLLLWLDWTVLDIIMESLLMSRFLPNANVVQIGISPLLPRLLDSFYQSKLWLPNRYACESVLNSLNDAFPKAARMSMHCENFRDTWTELNAAPTLQPESESSPPTIFVLSSDVLNRNDGHLIQSVMCSILAVNAHAAAAPSLSLLLLGPCASAPTHLKFHCPRLTALIADLSSWHFVVEEDVCVEGEADVGGVLYRYSSNPPQNLIRRLKRLSEGVVVTEVIEAQKIQSRSED